MSTLHENSIRFENIVHQMSEVLMKKASALADELARDNPHLPVSSQDDVQSLDEAEWTGNTCMWNIRIGHGVAMHMGKLGEEITTECEEAFKNNVNAILERDFGQHGKFSGKDCLTVLNLMNEDDYNRFMKSWLSDYFFTEVSTPVFVKCKIDRGDDNICLSCSFAGKTVWEKLVTANEANQNELELALNEFSEFMSAEPYDNGPRP